MEHASTSVTFEAYKHILKEAAAILPKGCPREIRLLLGPRESGDLAGLGIGTPRGIWSLPNQVDLLTFQDNVEMCFSSGNPSSLSA